MDIAKRIRFILPKEVEIEGFGKPVAIFNASILKEENIKVYARAVLGYYKYVSYICEFEIEDFNQKEFKAKIIIYPDNKYDFWGCEDPRAQIINGKEAIIYTGRTVWREERIPTDMSILAIKEENWKKRCVFLLRDKFISLKDSVLLENFILFRPHIKEKALWIGKYEIPEEFKEIYIEEPRKILRPRENEDRVGWSCPPIEFEKNKYLVICHARLLDETYRVFAVVLEKEKDNLILRGITPYFMEPREIYEKIGDRPFVIYPCGAILEDDRILISYGASDMFIGFCEVDLSELLSMVKEV